MTLVKGQLIDSKELSKPTKSGIRIISEMSTLGIMWFVARKHRVGLLVIGNVLMGGHLLHLDNAIAALIF